MEKKLYITLLICFSISLSVFSQIGNFNPKANFSLLLNTTEKYPSLYNGQFNENWEGNGKSIDKSFSMGLAGRFFLKKRTSCLVIKSGVSRFLLINNISSQASGLQSNVDIEIRMNSFYVIPGIQFNAPFRFVNFFGVINLPFTSYGKGTSHYDAQNYDPTTNALEKSFYNFSIKGGFSSGIGFGSGMDLFLLKRFSVGMEISMAALYTKFGGSTNSSYLNSYFGNNNKDEGSLEKIHISPIKSSINISYWIGSTPSIKNPLE